MRSSNHKDHETLTILQEECAEVIVVVSKITRFGLDSGHDGRTNQQRLEEEIGDVQAMIDLLLSQGMIRQGNLELARQAKFEKLKKWSNIYD